jgi:hypothetical protein
MKSLVFAASLTALSALSNAALAEESRWCATIYGEGGRENCHFSYFQQCQESVSGRGGFCRPSQYRRSYARERGYERGYRTGPGY